MFAVVRTGGKQYRVAPGDKIVVEKLDGNAGDSISITDILFAGEGGDVRSLEGMTVGAEIIAQAKADKVTVFKKRRRHNYRRKKGHRQQHTILRIVSIGESKEQKRTPSNASASSSSPSEQEETSVGGQSAETKPAKGAKAPKAVSETSTNSDAPAKAAPKKAAKPAKSDEE